MANLNRTYSTSAFDAPLVVALEKAGNTGATLIEEGPADDVDENTPAAQSHSVHAETLANKVTHTRQIAPFLDY